MLGDCDIKFVSFEESKKTFWHSSAHILGSVIEEVYPNSLLTMGPAIKEGFFYDFYPDNDKVVHESDYPKILEKFEDIVN